MDIELQNNSPWAPIEEQINKLQTVFCSEREFGAEDISRCEV